MFDFKHLFILVIVSIYLVEKSVQDGDDGDKPKKPTPLNEKQLEFAKTWWKGLGSDQKPQRNNSGEATARSRPKARAIQAAGDQQFLDSAVSVLFPMGDKFGGMPDDIVSMGTYCINFIIQGIIVIAYTTVRWPHKILLKAMIALGALTFLPTNTLYCLNPMSAIDFVKKGAIVNKKMDELSVHQEEFKKRLANSYDRFGQMDQMQKHSCCAWFDWKKKTIATVDAEAKKFVEQWFIAFFKIHEIIYCQIFTVEAATKWCNEFEFMEMAPTQTLPRSWMTIVVSLFARFF